MITPLVANIKNTLNVELPNELYGMMASLKYTIDIKLEPYVVRTFNIPILNKIRTHTTPNDEITRTTISSVNSYFNQKYF